MKTGFFIGRFQPLHRAHVKIINSISKKVDYLIIGIGSSNKYRTVDNPFTLKERVDMLNETLKIKNYTIKPIPDTDDYAGWVKHVLSIIGHVDIVFTGNKIVKELFEREKIEVEMLESRGYVSATAIRDMIFNDEKWEKYVPEEVSTLVEKVGGVERIKTLMTLYKNPIPTVDVVIEANNGIVLIERKHEPFGWALPGGHVNYGETVEEAAVREVKEETSLDIKLLKLLGVYSDPKRDPRNHKISIVFLAKAYGKLIAGDDAKRVGIFRPDELPELAFDHRVILEDYFNGGQNEKFN